jgi:hypothetical protein
MLFQRLGRYQQALGFYLSLRDSAESMMVSDRAQMLANLATEPIFFPAYDPPMTPACQVGGSPMCEVVVPRGERACTTWFFDLPRFAA